MPDSKDMDSEVKTQHSQVQITAISSTDAAYQRTTHPDAQWYPTAGLGLFFHWGISSVLGQGDLSWSMMKRAPGGIGKAVVDYGLPAAQVVIPPAKYWAQAEKFTADRYNPGKWLAAAAAAGVKYAVLTTKHHDGFALWPSEHGDFNTRTYLGGRDLVGEFVQACRKNSVKVGFYYSPPDWYYHRRVMSFNHLDNKPTLDINHQPVVLPVMDAAEKAAFDEGYRQYVRGQVVELITRYGAIDVLWFDGRLPDNAISMDEIRTQQPGIVINPRGHGYGDFDTPECRFPATRLPGWWEYCHVFADGAWGYLDHEIYKPIGWFLGEYSKARAWDGNFLPNVAPDSHGELPDGYYLRMRQLKEWMTANAKSVVGTQPGNWPEQSNVPTTRSAGILYAHLDWIFEGEVRIAGVARPMSARLLATGADVPFAYQDGVLTFTLPSTLKSNKTDVVELCGV